MQVSRVEQIHCTHSFENRDMCTYLGMGEQVGRCRYQGIREDRGTGVHTWGQVYITGNGRRLGQVYIPGDRYTYLGMGEDEDMCTYLMTTETQPFIWSSHWVEMRQQVCGPRGVGLSHPTPPHTHPRGD